MFKSGLPLLLYATDTEGLGGSEAYLATLIAHADRSRFRIGLWMPDRPATRPLAIAAEDAGAQVVTLQDVHRRGLSWGALRHAVGQLRCLRPSIVHFVLHEPRRCAEAMMAAALVRVPKRIVTFQFVAAPRRFGGLSDSVRRLSRRLQYSTLHHLVAVSSGNGDTLKRHFGVPSRRLSVIRNGVDTNLFRPGHVARIVHARWHIPSDAPIIGIAARLTHDTGQHVLLEAMRTVWRTYPNTHVVLAGNGPAEPVLRAQAATLARSGQVHLVGQPGDMRAFFAQLDVCVLPSFAEGLPFAVLEAMAMSLPVVTSAFDGSSEAVEHEESGLLVEPRDEAALAHALVRLLGDRDLRMRLVSRNHGS